MSLVIACSQSLQEKLAAPIHPAENHDVPLLDVWHSTLFSVKAKNFVLFTNQVTAFSLLVKAEDHMSFEKFESIFTHALKEQIDEDPEIAQYRPIFERKLKHGVTLDYDDDSTLHELAVEIQKLFTEDPSHMNDLTLVAHQINNTEFPELEFKSPRLTLLSTLASLPHDEK